MLKTRCKVPSYNKLLEEFTACSGDVNLARDIIKRLKSKEGEVHDRSELQRDLINAEMAYVVCRDQPRSTSSRMKVMQECRACMMKVYTSECFTEIQESGLPK